jgi:hypothetical protein
LQIILVDTDFDFGKIINSYSGSSAHNQHLPTKFDFGKSTPVSAVNSAAIQKKRNLCVSSKKLGWSNVVL